MCCLCNNKISDELENADQDQDDQDCDPAHIGVSHLVAVSDGEITKSAGTDGSGHGCDTDQADECDHGNAGDTGDAFL